MSLGRPRPHPRRVASVNESTTTTLWAAPMLVVLALLALVAAGMIAVMLTRTVDASDVESTLTPVAAPPAEVDRIHAALHEMGAVCTRDADEATQVRIETAVDLLVEFALRYPNATFQIDDETGRSLGLLLVARNEMQVCAPRAAARANAALPSQYRDDSGSEASAPHR